jgi:EAL domain-containing protein (putative c-di-GMP-specific phosphodiesterase class I)
VLAVPCPFLAERTGCNHIKIDRGFMRGFDGSARDAETIVKTIIALGREPNMPGNCRRLRDR